MIARAGPNSQVQRRGRGHTLQAGIWDLEYEVGALVLRDPNDPGSRVTSSDLACVQRFDEKTFSLFGTSRSWISDVTGTGGSRSGRTLTTTYSYENGRAFYPAWSIEWMQENNTSLDPPWPTLTHDMYLATWTPGEQVPTGTPSSFPTTMPMKTAKAAIATLSVLAFLFALGCLFLLWKIRHAKQAAKMAEKERIAEERSRTMMCGDDGGVREPQAVQKGWWQKRRGRQMASREPKDMELVERDLPLR